MPMVQINTKIMSMNTIFDITAAQQVRALFLLKSKGLNFTIDVEYVTMISEFIYTKESLHVKIYCKIF